MTPPVRSSSHALSFSSFTTRASHVCLFSFLVLFIFLAFSDSSFRSFSSSSTHERLPTVVGVVSAIGFQKKGMEQASPIPLSGAEPPSPVPTGNASSSASSPLSASPLPSAVEEWEVSHVRTWVTEVVKSSELLPVVEENHLDGLTLLELPLDNLFEYFPSVPPLRRIKLRAHLQRLQEKRNEQKQSTRCLCGNERKEWEQWKTTGREDLLACWREKANGFGTQNGGTNKWSLWQQLADHPRRTLMLGSSVALFPRSTMLAAYFFYPEVYDGFIGKPYEEAKVVPLGAIDEDASKWKVDDHLSPPPLASSSSSSSPPSRFTSCVRFLRKVLFWTALVMTPNVYPGIYALWFIRSSYLVMPIMAMYFFILTAADLQIGYGLYTHFSWSAVLMAMLETRWFLLIAVAVSFVLSFLPWWLSAIAVLAFVALLALICIGIVGEEVEDFINKNKSEQKKAEEGSTSAGTPPSDSSPRPSATGGQEDSTSAKPKADPPGGEGQKSATKTEGKKHK